MNESILIDDFGPLPVHRPATVADLCRLVKNAAATGQGVYPVGGRTMLDIGLPPIKPGIALNTTALNQVIDYPARDMTITVQAGITMARLQETLAAEGQWLPVDVPDPEHATLGGAIALNISGPRRFGYGTLRDYVIGISFVTDDGDEVKAGGRVVKNVAGYDLMKLQVGAVGTLGVITQLTLKVKPKPTESLLVTFHCETADLGRILDLLHASRSRPCAVELLNRAAWQAGGINPLDYPSEWVLAVGLEEKEATIDWQLATLVAELNSASVGNHAEISGLSATRVWRVLTDLQARPESKLIWKANVLPSKAAELAHALSRKESDLIHAEGLNGIIWVHSAEGSRFEPPPIAGANFTVRRCPTAWKKDLPVWGRPTNDRDLMRRVKQTLDPRNVFNPGRLFGDL